MLKKILCIVLTLVSLMGLTLIGVSAAEVDVQEVGADTVVYFEVPSDWKNYKHINCHIFPYGGKPLANWTSKKERCTLEEDGRWSYNFTKVGGLESGTYYCIIFATDTSIETYSTLMTTDCYGDTLYCNDTYYENPVDSNKSSRAAFWKNHSSSQYGPLMQITSIGNLIGTCLPPGVTATDLFNKFLTETLDNARQYSGKTDQDIIDDMAEGLGLSQDSVEKLIAEAGIDVAWEKAKSDAPIEDKPITPSNPSSVGTGIDYSVVIIAGTLMFISIAALAVALLLRRKAKK